MASSTLISFIGPHDPFTSGPVAGQEVLGPVLQILRARPFTHLILLDRPGSSEAVVRSREAVAQEHPDLKIEVVGTTLKAGPRLAEAAKELRSLVRSLRQRVEGPIVLSLASAPPKIYSAALLILAGGEFDVEVVDLDPKLHPALERTGLDRLVGLTDAPDRLRGVASDAEGVSRQQGLVADHPIMRRLLRAVEVAAPHDAPLLISGETGSGRTTLAGLVHRLSKRGGEVCLTFDCGSLAEDAAEVTLFGQKRGRQLVPGLLERASGGSLVLEDVGELPRRIQRRLEHVLITGKYEPVGASKEVESNARIIATSARDLRQETQRGSFRADLHRILAVAELVLPPLRERSSDIPKLIASILAEINAGLREPRQLSRDAMVFLSRQEWPGNLRELRAVIERGAMISRTTVIETDDLLTDPAPNSALRVAEGELPALYQGFSMEDFLSKIRRGIIFKAIDQAGGNQSEASRLLGVSPQAVNKFLKVEQTAALTR